MNAESYLRKNLTVPNVLSLFRLLLVPVYVVLFVKGRKYMALAAFAIASLTDLLDGIIARKYNLITDLGKLLDPVADKLMVLTALFSMAIGNKAIPPVMPWAAVITVLFKEVLLMIGGLLMLNRGIVVHSAFVGKTAQVVFVCGLVACFFHDQLAALCAGWFMTPDLMLVWLGVALTLIAFVVYVERSLRQVFGHEEIF